MRSLWYEIAMKTSRDEDPTTFMVLADMVMELGEQEDLKQSLLHTLKDLYKWIPSDWREEAYHQENRSGEYEERLWEYNEGSREVWALKQIAIHIFAPCGWCDGCQYDATFKDWQCNRCVSGLDLSKTKVC